MSNMTFAFSSSKVPQGTIIRRTFLFLAFSHQRLRHFPLLSQTPHLHYFSATPQNYCPTESYSAQSKANDPPRLPRSYPNSSA